MRKAFACDKRVINIDETNIGEIQIIDHSVKLNLTRTPGRNKQTTPAKTKQAE